MTRALLRLVVSPSWWFAEQPASIIFRTSLLFGLAFALSVLEPGYLLGNGDFWQLPPYDAGMHLSGLRFFLADSWHFPLFHSERMGAPEGMGVTYTDGIPLLALPAKLIGPQFFHQYHYFGAFFGISFVLNTGLLGALISRLWRPCPVVPFLALIGACFGGFYNLQFESLSAHWLILAAFLLYFRITDTTDAVFVFPSVLSSSLLAASLLIHPYLFAISGAIVGLGLLQKSLRQPAFIKTAALWSLATGSLLGLIIWISGFLAYDWIEEAPLYGAIPAFALDPYYLFVRNPSPDHWDYSLGWGGGFLLLVAAALLLGSHRARELMASSLRRHWVLVCGLLFFVVFAISNTLYWEGEAIVSIPLSDPVLGVFNLFRSSHRFILPVYYIGFVALVAFLSVSLAAERPAWLLVCFVAAMGLQLSYRLPGVQAIAEQASQPEQARLDSAFWLAEMQQYKQIAVYPSYSCLYDRVPMPFGDPEYWHLSREFYVYAAKQGLVSNTIRSAKRNKNCADEEQRAESADWRSDTLYVYLKDESNEYPLAPPARYEAMLTPFEFGVYGALPTAAH